jgi:signal transduction histidine kinase
MAAEPAERPHPLRRRASVRVRATAAATLIAAVALVVGALGLLALLHRSQLSSLDAAARLRADDIATIVRSGAMGPALPGATSDATLVQVADASGHVVAASENIEGEAPVATFRPGGTRAEARTVDNAPIGDGEPFRVVALRVDSPNGPFTVYAATSLHGLSSTAAAVRAALAAGLPALVGLVAMTTWVLVGRALRPVERIRAQVASISTQALDRRVPEPAAEDEIGRLARTMNDMLDRLENGAERQRRFAADASHELRSPLASLRAQLEVAAAHPELTDWDAVVEGTLTEVDRMERLTADLLTVARTGDETLRRRERVDLALLARDEAAVVAGRGRVAVDTASVQPAVVTGDADQLRRVLRNLLDNAERHARSTVTVEVSQRGGLVELAVNDDGTGIPRHARTAVFDRFTRLEDSRDRGTGGSGLGLDIARQLVTAHHGTIEVADTDGGARLLVYLPSRPDAPRR